jgi:hypothetical protein
MMTQDRLQPADWFRAILVAAGYVTCRFVAWLTINAAFGVTTTLSRYETVGLFGGGLIAFAAIFLLFLRRRSQLGGKPVPLLLVVVAVLAGSWPVPFDARGIAHLLVAAFLTAAAMYVVIPRNAGTRAQ